MSCIDRLYCREYPSDLTSVLYRQVWRVAHLISQVYFIDRLYCREYPSDLTNVLYRQVLVWRVAHQISQVSFIDRFSLESTHLISQISFINMFLCEVYPSDLTNVLYRQVLVWRVAHQISQVSFNLSTGLVWRVPI